MVLMCTFQPYLPKVHATALQCATQHYLNLICNLICLLLNRASQAWV